MPHRQGIARLKELQPLESGLFYFSIVACLFVGPFTVYRFMQGHWFQAFVDTYVLILASYCMVQIYRRGTSDFLHLIVSVSLAVAAASVTAANGVNSIYWMYPTIAISFFLVPLNAALIISGMLIFTISALIYDPNYLARTATIVITMMVSYLCTYFIFRSYREIENKLKSQAQIDALTGAGNRLAFDKEIKKALELSRRDKQSAALLLFDLDDFKRINDSFGHDVGDRVLIETVELVTNNIRESDHLFRYGGEEFAIILSATEITAALRVAEKVRATIEAYDFGIDETMTISGGIAPCKGQVDSNAWIKSADKLLYLAKGHGKNQIAH